MKSCYKILTERDGTSYYDELIRDLKSKITQPTMIERFKKELINYKYLINEFINNLDPIFNLIIMGRKLYTGQIKLENEPIVYDWIRKTEYMLSSKEEINSEYKLKLIQEFEKITNSPATSNITYSYNYDNKMILNNVVLELGNITLVAIDHLELKMGKYYAFTGTSGCGKSTVLSKIKGIMNDGIKGSGEISYPYINNEKPKIAMITQKNYFPIDATLLEGIYFPNILPKDPDKKNVIKTKVIKLLREIGLNSANKELEDNMIDKIEEKGRNWDYSLSGGQMKKVAIVSSIMYEPDILILDESLTGLDKRSIDVVQKMYKKYLADKMLIVVDHHAEENNYANFYEFEIYFNNKTVTVINNNNYQHDAADNHDIIKSLGDSGIFEEII